MEKRRNQDGFCTCFGVSYGYTLLRKGLGKQEGRYRGRTPLNCPEFDAIAASWQNGEIKAVEAIGRLKMSKTTFYRKMKKWREENA